MLKNNLIEDNWIEEILEQQISELQTEQKSEYWFSLSAISNVPLINYWGLSEEECLEVKEQTQNVLRSSRNENNYKEVAITYSLTQDKENKEYIKVLGDYTSVFLMQDRRIREMLDNSNSAKDLIVISIHNHPNDSGFSLNDILVFAENSSIKLMSIVNKQGEVSFLLRPSYINLSKLVFRNILDVVPDFLKRKNDWQIKNPDKSFTFPDLLNSQERKIIVNETITDIQEMGCFYSDYVDKDKAQQLEFKQSKEVVIDNRNGMDVDYSDFCNFDEDIEKDEYE